MMSWVIQYYTMSSMLTCCEHIFGNCFVQLPLPLPLLPVNELPSNHIERQSIFNVLPSNHIEQQSIFNVLPSNHIERQSIFNVLPSNHIEQQSIFNELPSNHIEQQPIVEFTGQNCCNISTRGPRGPWNAHLRQKIFKFPFFYCFKYNRQHLGGLNLNAIVQKCKSNICKRIF